MTYKAKQSQSQTGTWKKEWD